MRKEERKEMRVMGGRELRDNREVTKRREAVIKREKKGKERRMIDRGRVALLRG